MLVKVSLLALYLRVFKPSRKVNIIIYTCIGVVMAFYLSTMIAELVVGIPKSGNGGWQEAQMNYGPFGLDVSAVRGVFGIVSDFAILLIPLTQIVQLNLPLKRKVVLVCIFLTGLLYVLITPFPTHPQVLFSTFDRMRILSGSIVC